MNCARVRGARGHGSSTKYGGVAYYGAVRVGVAVGLQYMLPFQDTPEWYKVVASTERLQLLT